MRAPALLGRGEEQARDQQQAVAQITAQVLGRGATRVESLRTEWGQVWVHVWFDSSWKRPLGHSHESALVGEEGERYYDTIGRRRSVELAR